MSDITEPEYIDDDETLGENALSPTSAKEALEDNVEEVVEKGESVEQERKGIGFSVDHVTVAYGGVVALQDVTFRAEPGERIAIFGNNGSGKTTLCDVISGMVKPTQGDVAINGKVATKKSPLWRARRGMRRIFQRPVLFEDLSLEENVLIGSPLSKGDGIFGAILFPRLFHNERVETARRIMEYCGLDPDPTIKPDSLSYGDKKRLELARALMGNPRILILDEPSGSLNEKESAQYCQVVLDYVETFSTTLIVVENDINFARLLCERAIVIDAGEVLADGEVLPVLRNEDVKKRYLVRNEK